MAAWLKLEESLPPLAALDEIESICTAAQDRLAAAAPLGIATTGRRRSAGQRRLRLVR